MWQLVRRKDASRDAKGVGMKATRTTILLLLILILAMAAPVVQAARAHDAVTVWVRNLTSYEYNMVLVGPSPWLVADSSHQSSQSVYYGPAGRYGYTLERQDGYTFRGDIFAPRDSTLALTIMDGNGPDPVLTVTRSSQSPWGQPFSTTYILAAVLPEVLAAYGAPDAASSLAPAPAAPAPTATPVRALTRNDTYVVQPGDTIPKIAALVGMWPSVVAWMNGVPTGNIYPGQVLQFRTYTVVPGDTLFIIASKLATTRAQVIAANPGLNLNELRHGQVINAP